MALKVDF
jgi:hypothetical protein